MAELTVEDFMKKGCECSLGFENSPCSSTFPKDEFSEGRDKFMELSNEEIDMFLLFFLQCTVCQIKM